MSSLKSAFANTGALAFALLNVTTLLIEAYWLKGFLWLAKRPAMGWEEVLFMLSALMIGGAAATALRIQLMKPAFAKGRWVGALLCAPAGMLCLQLGCLLSLAHSALGEFP